MSRHFVRARPLQASKLATTVVVLLYAAGVYFGIVPTRGITSLFIVPVLGFALVVVVLAETLLLGYRSLRTAESLSDRFGARPRYALVRGGEVLLAFLPAVAFVVIVERLPDGPMSGPGAIGLFFVVVGLGLLAIGGCLVRTLVEYYHHRRRYQY